MKIFLKNYYKILIAIALAVAVFWLAFSIYRPLHTESSDEVNFQVIEINKGDSSAKVARLLAEQNLVRNRFLFLFYTLATGQEKKFQAGRYKLSSAMSIPKIVQIFSAGLAESDDITVTIPEGFNVFEIDRKISISGLIQPGELFRQVKVFQLEGHLFPDTYRFDKKETVERIIKKMEANLDAKVKEKPSYQQLIIASLLEKEVRKPKDMALVAGIIYKRLELGMLLQIDATVAYGACLNQNVSKYDVSVSFYKFCDVSKIGVANFLTDELPYNTYLYPGLPPGPISNPGQKAIKAALYPQESEYLFYLSARSDGRTIFSRTAAEHERNRAKYLK